MEEKVRNACRNQSSASFHELLQKRFLTKQKRSLAAFHREVAQACKAQKLRVPARNTVALRIAGLDPLKVIRRREGQDAARDLQGVGGDPPAVTAPLEQVQIDHTVIDLIVVDDATGNRLAVRT